MMITVDGFVGNHTCPPLNAAHHVAVVLILTLSILSILGSILVTITFAAFKELRSTSRKLFLFLCLSNGLCSVAHISMLIIYLVSQSLSPKDLLIYIPNIFSIYFNISSYFWTGSLTVYLYMVIVRKRITINPKIFHSLSWTIPGVVVITVVLLEHFLSGHSKPMVCLTDVVGLTGARWDYIRGAGWELATYIIIIPFFSLTCVYMLKKRNSNEIISSIQSASRKLLFVPVIFCLFRGLCTVRFMVKYYGSEKIPNQLDDCLLIIQAIGNNSQGLVDAILFCFCTKRIRRRLAVAMFCSRLRTSWRRKSRGRPRNLISNFERRLEENAEGSYEIVHLNTFEQEPMI